MENKSQVQPLISMIEDQSSVPPPQPLSAVVATHSTPYFAKLEGSCNYATWSFAMKMYLIDNDLWDCVNATSEDAGKFAQKDAKARAKICLSINENLYPVVMTASTSTETWKRLRDTYADNSLGRRLKLMKKILTIKLENYSNVEAYVNDIRHVQQQLIAIQAGLDDELVGVIMLAGLGDIYSPMVMAIEHSGTRITSDSIASILLKEERRDTPTTSSALMSNVNSMPARNFNKVSCTYCKKLGHVVSECRKRMNRNKNNSSSSSSSSHVCNNTSDVTLSSCFNHTLTGFTTPSMCTSTEWYVDSGATAHMTNKNDWFLDLKQESKPITVANGQQIQSEGKGTVSVNFSDKFKQIPDVLYVPDLATNLISVHSLVQEGLVVIFSPIGASILLKDDCKVTGSVVATASNHNGMYRLDLAEHKAACTQVRESALLWHRRLGHLHPRALNILKNRAVGIDYTSLSFSELNKTCVPCLQGKMSKRPFKNSLSRSNSKLELIHSDLCGPMSTHSWGGALYLLTFTDDFTRKTFGYMLKSKSEVFSKFVEFKSLVENQTGLKIKSFRSDNGTEFVNHDMTQFFKENGIVHQTTVPYTPQQNGVSERVNRTVVEKARSMLQDSGLPRAYWGEAVSTAIYLKNLSPTQALNNRIPEEMWTGKKVNLHHLRVFGCEAHVLIPKEKRKKLDCKTQACIFVGYLTDTKGYRLVNPQNPRSIIIARDVHFVEDKPPSIEPGVETTQILDSQSDNLEFFNSVTQDYPAIPHLQPTQVSTVQPPIEFLDEPPAKLLTEHTTDTFIEPAIEPPIEETSVFEPESEVFVDAQDLPVSEPSLADVVEDSGARRYPLRDHRAPNRYSDSDYANLTSVDCEPQTYKQALDDSHSQEWLKAMQSEHNSLQKHGTWTVVNRPVNRKVIKCKWVYKVKRDTNGNIVKYKARLVAKGFTQVHGVDYGETFSPVARLSSIRLLLAFAAKLNLDVDHLDVETAFLNGDLEEEIFMEQPEGFSNDKSKVCLLKKSLYGLKQAPRQWNKKVCEAMDKLSFKRSEKEHCIYYKHEDEKLLVVAVFVDDFFIFSNDKKMKEDFKDQLKKSFIIKDLGPLKDCLGMRVTRKDNTLSLDQIKYIEQVIAKFGMTDAISVTTPMETGTKLVLPDPGDEKPELPYQQLIGSLMYISIGTRPDISHVVSALSQFNVHYGEVHWRAAKRVLRYLKATKDKKLIYSNTGDGIGYADADYASNLVDRRSYTGYVFQISGSSVSWESRKQRTVAQSTTEAEYMALGEACKEAIYIRSLISDIFQFSSPITIMCDNQSAISLTKNNTHHSRTKHIDIRHHFVRECISTNQVDVKFISSTQQIADILTKPLPKLKHYKCLTLLGLA